MSNLVAIEVVDGVARLTINRPEALNALNPAVVFQLHQAFGQASADTAVRGIVLAGAGRAFVSGADVSFFCRNLESGDVKRIVAFTQAGHRLLDDLDRCPKPVVACVHGAALGGGLELALACDSVLAAPQASLGFPETTIGLYPGLGGTQRAPRRIGVGLAKWLLYTAKIISAPEAMEIGLVDRIVPGEELETAARQAILAGPMPRSAPMLSADHTALEDFFRSSRVDDLLAGRSDTRGHAALARAARRVSRNGPTALRFVERFIDEGIERPLAEALQLELQHLETLFHTTDAREGLCTLGKRPT